MADDQVKYSDLIADDVVKGFELLNQVMQELKTTMAALKTEATNVGSVIKGMGSANRDQQQEIACLAAEIDRLKKQMKGLSDEEKKVAEIKRQYKKLTDDQIARVDKLASALSGLRTADEAQRKHALARINLINVENMSYNELQATYNALKDSLNAMTVAERQNTEAGKAMTVQSAKIYDTMNELQKATGKYTLQVGKYRAAFDGLGYSFQQILREAPSALNLNQFFLAISNNIPMFLDQLKAYKNEQAEIKANLATMTKGTAEYAEQLGKVESVGKKLGRTLMSWQTLVLVGLMILRNWDKIVSGISNLFSNLTKEQRQLKTVNEAAASTVGELTAKYVALQNEWKNLKKEDIPAWLEKHQNDWNELGKSIDSAEEAENFYVKNTDEVINAINKRARSIAGMKLAAEKYEEAFKKQAKAEQDKNNGVYGVGGAVRVAGKVNVGAVGGRMNAKQYEEMKKQAAENGKKAAEAAKVEVEAYYEKQMEEVERLIKEAQGYLSFVDNKSISGSGSGSGSGGSEPTEQDVNMRQWDAVKARIKVEKEGYDEERALAKANYDESLEELKDWALKEQAALKENRDNGFITEKEYRQKLKELSSNFYDLYKGLRDDYDKEIEASIQREKDEKEQAAKEAAKEAERLAKENAKKLLDAEAQNWEKRRTEMVEQGKTRKEMLEAEFAAEIARLNIMKDLNRDVNGEKMSDEQRQKIEEWIKLLKQLQAAGNFRGIQLGSIFGKGASGLGGEKNKSGNYSNIMDVLFGEKITKDQQSALVSVFDQAKAALNSWMDARKEAADQAKELADDEVSAAENALNREIELRNQGYANDVALREKELADAKEKQKRALEEQKKISQQQILLDAAMQTSSLITASANIWKQFGTKPLLAIAMLGTMWGSFLYSKAKAYQVSQKSVQFREGGVMMLEGGSHESGHDVNLGVGPDGSNLRAEGGEYFAVINKRNSRKYGSEIPAVVNALNSGMFEDRYIKTSDAVGLLPRIIRADDGSAVDLSAVESGVGQLVKQGESRWSTEGEYRVMRYKNLTRRVRISG